MTTDSPYNLIIFGYETCQTCASFQGCIQNCHYSWFIYFIFY